MLKRITYVSRFAKPFSESELEKLGESSARNNEELGVTGVLMTSGGIFFQILEGPEEAVDRERERALSELASLGDHTLVAASGHRIQLFARLMRHRHPLVLGQFQQRGDALVLATLLDPQALDRPGMVTQQAVHRMNAINVFERPRHDGQ